MDSLAPPPMKTFHVKLIPPQWKLSKLTDDFYFTFVLHGLDIWIRHYVKIYFKLFSNILQILDNTRYTVLLSIFSTFNNVHSNTITMHRTN